MKQNALIGLLVLIFTFSVFMLIKEVSQSQSEKQQFEILQNQVCLIEETITIEPVIAEDLETDQGPSMLSKYAELYNTNNDMVGWIKVENTNINYPVMQTVDDEEFYLNRDFNKGYSLSGTPFLSADSTLEDSCGQLITYAHNMKNGTMFSDFLLYKSQDFGEENKTIDFDTLYTEQSYEVFAVFSIDVQVGNGHFPFYRYADFQSPDEFDYFIDEVLSLALYSTENPPSYGDRLLTLVTCDGSSSSGRFVVMAKLVLE